MPIVVAVNKIDKPGANPDNVKRELAELGLVPEAWGGTTVTVDVSAKKRQNLDLLLEMILLSSDILELKANPKKAAHGHRARGQARSRPRPGRDRSWCRTARSESATTSSPARWSARSARSSTTAAAR